MFFSSRLIALTTRQPIGQSMWHVQLYPPVILKLTATQWVNILLLFNLAQLVEHRTAVREVAGSSLDRTNTQGLKITEEKVLPL